MDLRKFQSKEDIPDRQAAITRLYWRPALRNHFQTRLNFHIRPNHQTRPNFQTILNFRTKPSLHTRPNPQTRPILNKTDHIFTQPSFQNYFWGRSAFPPRLFRRWHISIPLIREHISPPNKEKISPKGAYLLQITRKYPKEKHVSSK